MLTDDCPYSSFTDPDIASLMRNEGVPWRKGELTGKNSTHSGGKAPFCLSCITPYRVCFALYEYGAAV